MARRTAALRRAEQVVALRETARSIHDPDAKERIERVERSLRAELGPSMPKKQAAELLGVSVTALDKWIARGTIPIVRRAGSSRAEVESDTVLRLAQEQRDLERGKTGTLAVAIRRLAERRASERRITEAVKLSNVLTTIAAARGNR